MKTAESCRSVKSGIMKTLSHAACNALVPVCVLEGRFFSAGGVRRRLLVKTRESCVVFPDSEGNQNDVYAHEEQFFSCLIFTRLYSLAGDLFCVAVDSTDGNKCFTCS